MDTTTQERAALSPSTPLNIVELNAKFGRLSEAFATVAEHAVRAGLRYEAGGRGLDGQGVDGFGFLRMCCMAVAGRQLHDLAGYAGWPHREPRETRVANLLDDWGLTIVGDHTFTDLRRGDVAVFVPNPHQPGPAGEIVVAGATQDRPALVAACWAPDAPRIQPYRARYDGRIMVRVYRWVEAS